MWKRQAWRGREAATCFATAWPRFFLRGERTFGMCRLCWGTRIWPRPPGIPTFLSLGFRPFTLERTPLKRASATRGASAISFSERRNGILLTQDPIGLAGGVNLYEYAGSNPVSFDDPFGLCTPWPACANDYWDEVAVTGHQQGGIVGTAKAVGAVTMGALIEGSGINQADRGMQEIADGNPVKGVVLLGLAAGQNLPGGAVAANVARTVKGAQGATVTVTTVGKFTRATWEVAGQGGGASRTVWNKIIDAKGKTVRMFHDSYDRFGRFQHRKFKAPDEHIAR